MNDTANAFDRGVTDYQEWAETPWGRLRTEMIWQQLQRHLLDPGQRVLDAGCGLGQLAIYLALEGHTVIAFDFSGKMIAAAQARCSGQCQRGLAPTRCQGRSDRLSSGQFRCSALP